jgi:hypothetical protein
LAANWRASETYRVRTKHVCRSAFARRSADWNYRSKNQITDAQERAKDLLTESHAIFQSQRNIKKIAEAQTELALCYWRTGEIVEARDLLNEALARLTIDSELKAKAIIRLAIVERGATHHDKALRILTRHASLLIEFRMTL